MSVAAGWITKMNKKIVNMKRKTIKIFSVRVGKRLPVALMTLALAGAQMAFAQEAGNPWVGEALPADGGEFYLYNKAGGGFLLGANTWGTQGSLGQPGLVCTLAVSNGKYTIVTNSGGNGRGLGSDGYVDNAAPAEYSFTDPTPDDGLNEYVIDLNGSSILYWGGEGTVLKLDNGGSATEPQWLLVSRAQRERMLDNATRENGVDATFYILGAGFDRTQPSAWKETHVGGTTNLCGPGANANNHFYCAEAYDNSSFDIYQELTGIRNGRYRVTCSGFYRGDGVARNAMLYAGMNESPLLLGVDDGQGMPNDMNSAATAFANGRFTGNEVEVIVTDGTLRFGVKKNMRIASDWAIFDDFRLTYLGEATVEEAFAELLGALQNVQAEFQNAGATAIDAELQAVYDQYADASGDFATAQEAVNEIIASANGVRALTMGLYNQITEAQAYMDRVASGEVTLCDAVKTPLEQQLGASKEVLAGTGMAEMVNVAELSTATLDTLLTNAQTWVALSFPLNEAKNLADRVGGLDGSAEYQKVVADLNAAELTYDDMALDVAALNAVVREAMTPEFLAAVNAENELDMTSFITNPNIYNNTGVTNQMPGGWILGNKGGADNNNWCTVAEGDGALNCYNWSGNVGNDVTNAHYYQKIGVDGEGVSLPDGLYRLEAATYANTDPNKIVLYASSDSVNFDTVYLNRDQELYNTAVAGMGTTTTVNDIVVVDGKLYIGIKGADPVNNHQGGNGKSWNADNFRLYFVGADVLGAYRDRLRGRLADAQILHDSLMVCGIDDSDELGFALDEEDGYAFDVNDPDADESVILGDIDDIDRMMAEANEILANYGKMNPLLTNGQNFSEQLAAGSLFAQPKVRTDFLAALESAAAVAEDNSWNNWLSDEVKEQTELLDSLTGDFMNSVAVCYQMGTAKVLADQIGGLAETQAYQNVLAFMNMDELDPLDADAAAIELQSACLDAMTPEVLARASVEEPFNMTTFIVNPNIYQDAVDVDGAPIDTQINGWTLETNADRAPRTAANAGDTWMYTTSHSSNDSHNISSATNYRQVVGTQPEVAAEGKFSLPTGAYRVEAATFVDHEWEKLRLYAQTNSVELTHVEGSLGQDSIVYTYTEIESADSAFNGSQDVWDAAQASLGTTTAVPEIYVENGAVTIGIRGNGRIGRNDSWFVADNFRLYYVGQERGDNIKDSFADKSGQLSEIVDVYDVAGQLVRRQVKRADAVKGLKKGIYVVNGEKFVVAGN